MSKKTIEEVARIVNSEGLGYAIQSYMNADSIEDPVLAEKQVQAAELLEDIEAILSPHLDCA